MKRAWKLGMVIVVLLAGAGVFGVRPAELHANETPAQQLSACKRENLELQSKLARGLEALRECAKQLMSCTTPACPPQPVTPTGPGLTHRRALTAVLEAPHKLSVEEAALLAQLSTRVLRSRVLTASEDELPALRKTVSAAQLGFKNAAAEVEQREKEEVER